MTKRDQASIVNEQFGLQAANYVASALHATGDDLKALATMVADKTSARVLDLGCGGGHVSYNVAPHVAEVIAYDLSNDMLTAVAKEAKQRGLTNIGTVQGVAEKLPFPDQDFDFVFCRLTAHHWSDVSAGLKEARRVVKAGGRAVFIDVVSPGRPLLDTFLQTFEILRDPSHVRDYSVGEWTNMAQQAGFSVVRMGMNRMAIDFASWIARMKTPEANAHMIRTLQQQMADEVRAYYEIKEDGSFAFDVMALELEPI